MNTNALSDSDLDSTPQIATDQAGVWLAVWGTRDDPVSDEDIAFTRSTDGGATWSAPALLNTNAATDSGDDSGPRLATDSAGNWVAVWQSSEDVGGAIGPDVDILIARSSDGGITWTAPAALNTNAAADAGDDGLPAVATDGAGTWVTVWHSDDTLGNTVGADLDILTATSLDNGATWTAPLAVNGAAVDTGIDEAPQIATDLAGSWVAAWESTEDLVAPGGSLGTDRDIVSSRSTDAGATWSPAIQVLNIAHLDTGADRRVDLHFDGVLSFFAVWQSGDSFGGSIGFDEDLLYSQSTNGGTSWLGSSYVLDVNSDSDSGSDDDESPQLLSDGAGNFVAVWTLATFQGSDILTLQATGPDSDDDGLDDSDEVQIHGTDPLDPDSDGDGLDDGDEVSTHLTDPLAADSDGDGLDDGEEVNTHGTDPLDTDSDDDGFDDAVEVTAGSDPLDPGSTPLDVEFGASDVIDTASDDDREPHAAGDGSGNWVAVWSRLGPFLDDDLDIGVSLSSDSGVTWSSLLPLNTDATTDGTDADTLPQVVTDGAGNWLAVWTRNSNGTAFGTDLDVLVSRSTDAGVTWTAPAPLNTNAASDSGNDTEAGFATDGTTWVAVWQSDDDLGAGLGTDRDILVSRSTDAGATWTAPAALNTNAATDTGNDQGPEIATDGAGNWLAIWGSAEDLGGALGTDRDILWARSTDAGATWTAPAALNTNADSDTGADRFPHLAADATGTWVAVWESTEDLGGSLGTDVDILTATSLDAGATWSAPLAVNTDAASDVGSDRFPHLATDRGGNWLVTWQSNNPAAGDLDALVAHSTDDGATWSLPSALNPLPSTDSATDEQGKIATDFVGTWLAVWSSDFLAPNGTGDFEVRFALASGPDSDGDGLNDGEEANVYGTDPLDVDSDADGLQDGDEVDVHLTDPLDADSDDDGFSDGTEVLAGTDPNDALSHPSPVPALPLGVLPLLTAGLLLAARRTLRHGG